MRRRLAWTAVGSRESDAFDWSHADSQRTVLRSTAAGIVIDADTMDVAGDHVRLSGFDAPASGRHLLSIGSGGDACPLRNRIGSGPVRCEIPERDRYGRELGTGNAADSGDLQEWLVESSHALAYPRRRGAHHRATRAEHLIQRHATPPRVKELAMSELNLVLTREFSTVEADGLRRALGAHLQVGEPRRLLRRSADPALTALIEVIGSATDWLPLKAAATAYLAKLGIHAADATRNALRSRFGRTEAKPLAEVATALATTANTVQGRVEIVVGLNIPNEHLETCLCIEAREPEKIARCLAALIVRVETISEEMQAEIDAGRQPMGAARIKVCDDGSLLITWVRKGGGKECEKHIP